MGIFKKHGIDAEIDDEMIPVIDELNKLGLKTVACCSGHGKKQTQLHFDARDVTVLMHDGGLSLNWKR